MSFFTTKPEELSDEALDAIAQDAELKKAALAERERRAEERRLAAEKAEAEKAATARQAKVDALAKEHVALGEEAVRVNGALGAGVIGIKCVIEKRAALVDEARRVAAELRSLGALVPPLDLAFTQEAKAAGRVVVRVLEAEMVESPYAGATRNNPDAFRR
jgi:hypothetical protein